MKINRNNYEIYFLEYLEGRLTTEETVGLFLFAEENPDLKELIEGGELITLKPEDTIRFSPKFALKRNPDCEDESALKVNSSLNDNPVDPVPEINTWNYEEFMIRFHQNDLMAVEKSTLAQFLSDNPSLINEFGIYGKTLLKPDSGIIYPHKYKLKRNTIQRMGGKNIIAIISVAASVLIFSTLFLKYIHQPLQKDIKNQLAVSMKGNSKSAKVISIKDNRAGINPAQISQSDNATHSTLSTPRITITGEKSILLHVGSKPMNKYRVASVMERSTFELFPSFIPRQATLLATTPITPPLTIERRTDFDGITSIAYYDPDPDALPLNSERKTIKGRLGSALAKGISQTAGTIAREPEVERLLHGKISLSDIAGLGLAGFNLITDSKLSISREYDTDGKMKGYELKDGNKRLTRLP